MANGTFILKPVAIARSEAMLLGYLEAPWSILSSGTFLHEELVIEIFLRPFFLFHWFKKGSCQNMAKECNLSTGNLPLEGLPRNSFARINDRPYMTSAVDCGRKAPTQPTFLFTLLCTPKVVPFRSAKYS